MKTLFVADIHLHPARPETARLFVEFLAGPAAGAQSLYILGDLFDAWAGDDDIADPFNAALCTALHALAQAGTQVFFLPGNRDFLVGAAFAKAAGITLIADETVADIGGVPTLLLHGDTLCTDDHAYQDFRSMVRSRQWQHDFLAQPLSERKRIADALRSRSEAEKRGKPMALMDVSAAAVEQAFAAHNVARIIHGHTHRQARHEHAGRERWVLPEWEHGGGALACDATGCRFVPFPTEFESYFSNHIEGTTFTVEEASDIVFRGRVIEAMKAPFARAAMTMFVLAEVHPFKDCNGRIARLMMNACLSAASKTRIVVPTLFLREVYLLALKALSQNAEAEPLVRALHFIYRWSAAFDFADFDAVRREMRFCHAFEESTRDWRLCFPRPNP
ncbi:MAG: UDP-2,3-diacylglucosamine diphosphatase [Rhodocyclaceae bacterium]|nr:UDP-2,3-diacylglucosamine diphosphatase [Rhodocyclaceae bacterium]